MLNDTIINAERELYLTLLELAQQQPIAYEWLKQLPTWLNAIKDKANYAHAPAYQASVARLPNLTVNNVDLNSDTLTIDARLNESERKQTMALLKQLMPWRKGPFQIGGQIGSQIGNDESGIKIDTEWHSDWKWQRVAPHLGELKGRRVLDVGGGSGYHGWRMAGAGADTVIIIDPSCLFYHQFMAIRHFVGAADAHTYAHAHAKDRGRYRTHYIPVPLEALPAHSQLFDTVFSMGVLYHRQSPFEHLQQLRGQLVKGGELVLETLVVEGDANTVLVPHDRYAQMNNVYFLPSVAALVGWLEKAGFSDVRCVDVAVTSTEEQRKTEWMTYHSLADFLDPNDSTKTMEGYPAPMRATLIAKR
ncbi:MULTISPECIES: tRNA 5-methoxyuridine(34)/uridine 5-oxyacetic acid(34) synthase CmoB [unclassified Psychrobacter]|uniref:tRNA 5-methoxyuridine(34)/uridine 5-oxyacetic acid(34) synthase CmoB n=1 Tax=unclassified Psychrobacter TaxID=196806 RepID=UPI0025B382FC|nr:MULTISPECIES: tRNA 5-methoxyuridine(34)/uridine 5-oxyacetic acid(34) synthase CmoB [unclassified Psychrobacter]MDN3452018.1 tRNA 5-methoxyuridine(34)/uridine 5-oxyacetic acid(34) synthase CmoB [Psychrobacter sp. APC 3350]MDN3503454.1 tRNA 5-methoxyuridine(34)/uridine 5-oxyacetic acid(34) synthase CmoB [Psychrobacter sp. 5A.1]